MVSRILNINAFSDGDNRRPTGNKHFRDDNHYLDKLGEQWAKHQNLQNPAAYRLDRMPAGYSGWSTRRENNDKHVDRYLHGHPNGQFRSITEAWPHFLWLMEHGPNSDPCVCKQCSPKASSTKKACRDSSSGSGTPARFAPAFPKQTTTTSLPIHLQLEGNQPGKQLPVQMRRKQVDEDGVHDGYRLMLDKLEKAGPEGIDEPFNEDLSPDANATGDMKTLLTEWQQLPSFLPRIGEVVLFVPKLGEDEPIRWDVSQKKFQVFYTGTQTWADDIQWQAGVVTQIPTESCSEADLFGVPKDKKTSINQSGYLIEPLSSPQQRSYVALHAIRPFSLWKECAVEKDGHRSVMEALATASSFSILRKFHFKGVWPRATMFAQAMYLGPELLIAGDLVRFLGDGYEYDVMEITGIKLIFINLEDAGNDDYDDTRPYNLAFHISGRAFSLDPSRSFGERSAAPRDLPDGLPEGIWYSITDSENPKARLEIPYTRVISRYPGNAAISSWFDTSAEVPTSSSKVVNFPVKFSKPTAEMSISYGISGIIEARLFSQNNDRRIKSPNRWFFADTRVEQLNLSEVNNRAVGAGMLGTMHTRDGNLELSRADWMQTWPSVVKARAGKSHEKDLSQKVRIVDQARKNVLAGGESGLVASGVIPAAESAVEA